MWQGTLQPGEVFLGFCPGATWAGFKAWQAQVAQATSEATCLEMEKEKKMPYKWLGRSKSKKNFACFSLLLVMIVT